MFEYWREAIIVGLVGVTCMMLAMGCATARECGVWNLLDGKAMSWCEARVQSKKICKSHGGIKQLDPNLLTCNDDSEFGPVNGSLDYSKVWVREK